MRKARLIESCRCYHLISRLAHRAFFLDDEEKTLAVELLRWVEDFSGVIVLAYAIMSNHFHIFIYWDVIRDCHEKSMREAIRKAVGMKSRIHFIRYYIAPMLEK